MFESLGNALKSGASSLGGLLTSTVNSAGGLLKTASESAAPLLTTYLQYDLAKSNGNGGQTAVPVGTRETAGVSNKTLWIGGGVLLLGLGTVALLSRRK